jgi:hypothetical protein
MTLLAGSMSLSPGSAWTTTLVDSRMGQPSPVEVVGIQIEVEE